ncbi:MAG TPA: DNRLRE domain-containing protein [Flavobacterium sp.]
MSFIRICIVRAFLLCAAPAFATNYYSDPVAGSMNNSGSQQSPWGSLQQIFEANKTFSAGDIIYLKTGNHGYAIIKGINTGFVTIMPAPGQNPIVQRIRVSTSSSTAAAFWKLHGLTIQSESTGGLSSGAYPLIDLSSYATNITVSSCTLTSNFNTQIWTRDNWRNRCNNGIYTRPKLNSNHIIENNIIRNTSFGLSVASSNTIVRGNTIQFFTKDGVRILGSDILFENNKVTDVIKVMTNSENHDDLFQSYTTLSGGKGQDTLKNNIIRKNTFISATDITRAFVGTAQGIGCFDGPFLNWKIENNFVLTDHWHGISLYGAINCKVTNNTVLDPYHNTSANATNIGPAWILISQKSAGNPSIGNFVSNNLSAGSVNIESAAMGTKANNVTIGAIANYSLYFQDVSDMQHPGNFNLHLKPGIAAIDSGSSLHAPSDDFGGLSRPQGVACDLGAYEFSTLPLTLVAIADASVQSGGSANTNFGLSPELLTKATTDSKWIRETYIKFDISSLSGSESATLQLYGSMLNATGSTAVVNVYNVPSSTWTENAIKWSNKPASSSVVAATTTVSGIADQLYSWDVTQAVQSAKAAGQTFISLKLKNATFTAANYASFNSRQASANQPKLVIGSVSANRVTGVATASMDADEDLQFKLYPNPVKDVLFVTIGNYRGEIEGAIYDLSGKVVGEFKVRGENVAIPVDHLAGGLYIFQFNVDGKAYQRKVAVE